jgi:energy-coupling factor transport system ATP-binding protein
MNAIELADVSFRYAGSKAPALRQVTLAVPAGQICAIVGRAGAGKSTLCALISGFIPHFYDGAIKGAAHVEGQDVVAKPIGELIRHVALVGSNAFSQISGARYTVFEEIAFGLENLGVPRDEMAERANWALEAMRIAHLSDRSPYALSGGQQQRMVIAAALALRPPVLVLDEPTAQLDPLAVEELAELLRGLAAGGTTVVFAEHRLEWTAALAQRVLVLDEGTILADGEPRATLTDARLIEHQVGWPLPALIAERARQAQLWPEATPLPATLEQLVTGLAGAASAPGAAPHPAPEPQVRILEPPEIVRVEGVRFSYPSGIEALRGVSLTVSGGERVALLGRNGAGKSTLVRHLNGLLRPSAGRVLVAGADTRSTTVAKCARTVGIVFQDIRNQLFARTVRDELRFGPRNLGFHPNRVEQLVEQALEALDLADAADMHPYDLPAPRRRLVAVAAAVAMDVDLLLLDEPTAGLDNAGIALLARLIHDWAARGKSALVVSHDIDFCFANLARIVLMAGGEIVLDTPADAIDGHERAVLAENVGLPIGLQTIATLGIDERSPLGQALQPRPELLPPTSADRTT